MLRGVREGVRCKADRRSRAQGAACARGDGKRRALDAHGYTLSTAVHVLEALRRYGEEQTHISFREVVVAAVAVVEVD